MPKDTSVVFLPGLGGVPILTWNGTRLRRQLYSATKAAIDRRALLSRPRQRPPGWGRQMKLRQAYRKPHTSFQVQKELVECRYVRYGSGQLKERPLTGVEAAAKVGLKYCTAHWILVRYKARGYSLRPPEEPCGRARNVSSATSDLDSLFRDGPASSSSATRTTSASTCTPGASRPWSSGRSTSSRTSTSSSAGSPSPTTTDASASSTGGRTTTSPTSTATTR